MKPTAPEIKITTPGEATAPPEWLDELIQLRAQCAKLYRQLETAGTLIGALMLRLGQTAIHLETPEAKEALAYRLEVSPDGLGGLRLALVRREDSPAKPKAKRRRRNR